MYPSSPGAIIARDADAAWDEVDGCDRRGLWKEMKLCEKFCKRKRFNATLTLMTAEH